MIFVHDTPTNRLLNMVLSGGSSAAEYTATGNPVVFFTDLARPLKSLLVPFAPIQEGTGDPSPQNVRTIIPWDGLKVWNGGKNLLNPAILEQGGINVDGLSVSNPKRIRTGYIPVKENTYYCLSAGSEYKAFMHFYDKDKGSIGGNTIAKAKAPAGACFVRGIIGYQDETNIVPADCTTGQLEVVAQNGQATEYEPYKPITETDIVFPSPVYGGTLDVVSGVLTVEWAEIEINSASSAWYAAYQQASYNLPVPAYYKHTESSYLCNKLKAVANNKRGENIGNYASIVSDGASVALSTSATTKDEFNAWIAENPVTFVYKLATPQEITLTPEQITALLGDNTIWSDANGEMTAVYLKKG